MRPCSCLIACVLMISCGRMEEFDSLSWTEGGHDPHLSNMPTYWPREMFPLKIVYARTFNDDFPDASTIIENSLYKWNRTIDTKLFDLQGGTRNRTTEVNEVDMLTAPVIDPERRFGIYKRYRWPDHQSSFIAITSKIVQGYSRTILHADIFFNFDDYEFTTDGSGIDFESVLVHETGHVLGLIHNENRLSVMFGGIGGGQRKRHLVSYDYKNLDLHIKHTLNGTDMDPNEIPGLTRSVHALTIDGTCLEYRDSLFVGSHKIRNINSP